MWNIGEDMKPQLKEIYLETERLMKETSERNEELLKPA